MMGRDRACPVPTNKNYKQKLQTKPQKMKKPYSK